MKDKNKLIITIVAVVLIAIVIVGATYAYWSWTTSAEQQTNVTFTVTSGFSCGADGGETITSQQKILAPSTCTNPNYAFQRTITTNVTNNRDSSVYMDLYLKVNQIGTGLTNSQNFKYALTRQANDCTSNVVSQGTFNGVTDNGKVYLFRGSEYPTSDSDTYYLYVWLDAAETDSATQNQTFNISLGGECTDNSPYVYTVNTGTPITIGQAIPSGITTYLTPAEAMAAFSNGNRPFYLKHLVSNETVQESYVGFVVRSAMAQANPGMTAETYYLKGGDGGTSFIDNAKTIYDAFGSNCSSNPYTTTPSSSFSCSVSDLVAGAVSNGRVYAGLPRSWACYVTNSGASYCSAT